MNTEKVVLGAGCFWGVEAAYQLVQGVTSTQVGYSGGIKDHANYKMICTGTTKHVEVVEITFLPSEVPFSFIIDLFLSIHDPTQLNRQGNDIGYQYRSAIFYTNDSQKQISQEKIDHYSKNLSNKATIHTDIKPLESFFEAEEYHQQYLLKNSRGYCHINMSEVKIFIKSAQYYRKN